MATTIEWSIETLEYVNDSDQIVPRAHWRCNGWDEVNGQRYAFDEIGVSILSEITADADSFIAYADLRQEKCLEWAWAKLDKDRIEARVNETIEEQTTPALKSGKPWEE